MKKLVSKNPSDYPNNGLTHSPSHLKSIKDKIHTFPIQEQAKYADAICRAMVANHENCFGDVYKNVQKIKNNPSESKHFFESMTATGIGNFAYIAMNSSSMEEIQTALKLLELLNKYKKGEL